MSKENKSKDRVPFTEGEIITKTAENILEKYKDAFKELAK